MGIPFYGKTVFIEGLDKTGKTTLARRCRFEAKPAHPCLIFDRGYVGRMVFHRFYKEGDFPIEHWLKAEDYMVRHNMYAIVWLRCSFEELRRRHMAIPEPCFRDDQLEEQETDYELLIKERERLGVPVLELRTDEVDEDDCVEAILAFLGFEHANNK